MIWVLQLRMHKLWISTTLLCVAKYLEHVVIRESELRVAYRVVHFLWRELNDPLPHEAGWVSESSNGEGGREAR